VSDHCLVILYQLGEHGCTLQEMQTWVRPQMRANLARTLRRLAEVKDLAHVDGDRYVITRLGQKEVETRRLADPVF
jgi:hypothetical protein